MDRRGRGEAFAGMALAAIALVACQPSDTERIERAEQEVAETAESALNGIDTTAEAVWQHLQDVSYETDWARWPGTEPFYEGREPHGMLLTTYVNDAARDAIPAMRMGTADAMPLGAVIVKENYQPDSTLVAITVMYKARGYDAEHADWFWLKRLADGATEASGRVQSCVDCHEDGLDYLMSADVARSSSEGESSGPA